MDADSIQSIVSALAWPAVVLILLVIFFLLFRAEIRQLLDRTRTAKLPWGSTFDFEDPRVSPEETGPFGDIVKWGNSGNLFWLGHDLMWTVDVLLRNAPRQQIARGLRQSLHHIGALGLTDSAMMTRLDRLKEEAERSLEREWTPQRRQEYAREVYSILGGVAKLAEANQPDFDPGLG